jgi:hypothetical protein
VKFDRFFDLRFSFGDEPSAGENEKYAAEEQKVND